MIPSSLINVLGGLRNPRKHLTLTGLSEGPFEDADEQPDKGRAGRGLGATQAGSFCPCVAGVCHPPGVDVFPGLEVPRTPAIGILWRLPRGMINCYSISNPSPLSGGWGRGLG